MQFIQLSSKIKKANLHYFNPIKLEYATCIWNPHLDKDISTIENIQRRSVRFISRNCNWNSSVTKTIKDLNLETLGDRRITSSLCMFYSIVNNTVTVTPDEHLERSSACTKRKHHLQFVQIPASS